MWLALLVVGHGRAGSAAADAGGCSLTLLCERDGKLLQLLLDLSQLLLVLSLELLLDLSLELLLLLSASLEGSEAATWV